jgi:23S rRNA (adenine2503-C2)-methyltransferase
MITTTTTRPLLDASPEDVLASAAEHGGKAVHLKPLYPRLFRRMAMTWDEMTELSPAVRDALAQAYRLHPLTIQRIDASTLDGTRRYFFRAAGGEEISAVSLPEADRLSLCLSSQVGCAYACSFCASGLVKFQRQLSAAEIIDQILLIACDQKRYPTNLLFMGMGEPLANYAEVVKAIRWITASQGLNMGPSRISLSTSGLVPQILRLAEEGVRVRLAISLHAVHDDVRRRIMPVSGRFGVQELIDAARKYHEKTKSAVLFEYILLDEVNDHPSDADRLSELLSGFENRVNLIPYNPVAGLPYRRPAPERVLAFQTRLTDRGVRVYIRKPKGLDIGSACGQLGDGR